MVDFSVQQKVLGLSECERLTGRWSMDVEVLDSQCGGHERRLPGQPIELPLPYALNMLILSEAMKHSVEPGSMAQWLPGLRTEALLKLGEQISSWFYAGPPGKEQQFWSRLYGEREGIRPEIARLLKCSGTLPTRRLRFHSLTDVERLSNEEIQNERRNRTPLFILDAHDLADKMRAVCGARLFTVKVAVTA